MFLEVLCCSFCISGCLQVGYILHSSCLYLGFSLTLYGYTCFMLLAPSVAELLSLYVFSRQAHRPWPLFHMSSLSTRTHSYCHTKEHEKGASCRVGRGASLTLRRCQECLQAKWRDPWVVFSAAGRQVSCQSPEHNQKELHPFNAL